MSKPPTVKAGGETSPASVEDGIARLRMATGRPETRILSVVCGVHRKGYRFTCERTDPRAQFKMSKAIKDEPQKASIKDALFAAASKQGSINVSELDWQNADITCPWCNSSADGAICSRCSIMWCGGIRKSIPGERDRFTCPSCNRTGELVPAKEITVGSGASGQSRTGDNPQIGHAKPTLLSKWFK